MNHELWIKKGDVGEVIQLHVNMDLYKGESGERGPQGLPGAKGYAGYMGERGPTGDAGLDVFSFAFLYFD